MSELAKKVEGTKESTGEENRLELHLDLGTGCSSSAPSMFYTRTVRDELRVRVNPRNHRSHERRQESTAFQTTPNCRMGIQAPRPVSPACPMRMAGRCEVLWKRSLVVRITRRSPRMIVADERHNDSELHLFCCESLLNLDRCSDRSRTVFILIRYFYSSIQKSWPMLESL